MRCGSQPNSPRLHLLVFAVEWALVAAFLWRQGWPNVWDRLATSIAAPPSLAGFVADCPPLNVSMTRESPDGADCLPFGLSAPMIALTTAVIVMPVGGCATGFFVWRPRFSLAMFFVAGMTDLAEECWFRACLLAPDMGVMDLCAGGFIFWIYHLDLLHWQEDKPHFAALFRDGRFMGIIAPCLGTGCIALYVGSGGSLWACAGGHCVGLWVWLFLLGASASSAVCLLFFSFFFFN